MVAKTTDSTDFNLDLNSLAEEAWERCGKELRSGYDLRTTRRSLNLLTIEWANRGLNLWTIEEESQVLTYNTASYDIPVDTIDLIDHVIRTGSDTTQQDITINRISSSTYSTIPNKTSVGRPLQLWFQRKTGATNSIGVVQYPQVHLWPVPDNTQTWTLVYWRLRRMQNAGDGVNGQDIPFRLLPAMVAGLAYYLSLKIPEAYDRRADLKADYEQQFQLASEEDRERASFRFIPRIASIT